MYAALGGDAMLRLALRRVRCLGRKGDRAGRCPGPPGPEGSTPPAPWMGARGCRDVAGAMQDLREAIAIGHRVGRGRADVRGLQQLRRHALGIRGTRPGARDVHRGHGVLGPPRHGGRRGSGAGRVRAVPVRPRPMGRGAWRVPRRSRQNRESAATGPSPPRSSGRSTHRSWPSGGLWRTQTAWSAENLPAAREVGDPQLDDPRARRPPRWLRSIETTPDGSDRGAARRSIRSPLGRRG